MHWFKNLTTRAKLIAGFGVLVLLFVVVIATAFRATGAAREAERALNDMLTFRMNLNGQRAELLIAAMSAGAARDRALTQAGAHVADNERALQRLQARQQADARLGRHIQALADLDRAYAATRDAEVIPAIRQQTPERLEQARALILGVQAERFASIRDIAREFTDEVAAAAETRLARVQWTVAALGAAALLAAIIFVIIFNRLVAGPLAHLTAVADKIAHGDVNVEFALEGRTDEVGVLTATFLRMSRALKVVAGRARQIAAGDLTVQVRPQSESDVLGTAFAEMSASLRQIIQDLVAAADVLVAAAGDIMASTSQLACSAAETAAAVTQTTATVEEVKQTSQISSQKARTVSDQAQRAAGVAQSGKESVDQTIEGMSDIRLQMGAVAESILSLSAQSRTIGEIITTVDDLAAQSKLLAVNASIEAAKAGEEGKGFSVVAQEMKSLAEQSKQATTQVRLILSDIQKATSSAVLAAEQGGKTVEAGVRQSTSAGESIAALAESIFTAAQAATQIAATSQQQFVGMDQVAMAMENIKAASTQTVTSTRQAETAAQQLHGLGKKLKHLLERFTV